MLVPVLLALGLGAGTLTTIAGLGGGQLLVLALAAITTPHAALVLTAPALLAGNLHRGWMLRAHLERRTVLAFAAGAVPGALVGGLIASALPAWFVHGAMATMTLAAVGRSLWGRLRTRVGPAPVRQLPPALLAASGAGLGAIAASSSGAGLLLAPLLMLTGLRGVGYVATGALCAASLHSGRLLGYGFGGLLGARELLPAVALGAAIITGNLLGERLRRHIDRRLEPWIEQGTLVACVVLVILAV